MLIYRKDKVAQKTCVSVTCSARSGDNFFARAKCDVCTKLFLLGQLFHTFFFPDFSVNIMVLILDDNSGALVKIKIGNLICLSY